MKSSVQKTLIESVLIAFPFKNETEKNTVQYYCIDDFNFNASSTLFTQVLNNLIRNAFKAMAVKELSDSLKKIQITSYLNKQAFGKSSAFITMTDNGTGIKPEHLKKIMEPFFSTNDAIGHGLGLSFCKKVISACKGNMTIQSTYGLSTTITIEIPLYGSPSESNERL